MTWPTERHMSPQAWSRLRATMTDSELKDLAKDLAGWLGEVVTADEQAISDELLFALTSVDWHALKQA